MKSLLPRLIMAVALLPSLAFGTLVLDSATGCLVGGAGTTYSSADVVAACAANDMNCCNENPASPGIPACVWAVDKEVDRLCPDSCNGNGACEEPSGALDVGFSSCNGEDACKSSGAVGDISCNANGACTSVSGGVGRNSCNAQDSCDRATMVANCVASCAVSITCGVDGDCLTLDTDGCLTGAGTDLEIIQACSDNNLNCCVPDSTSPTNPACIFSGFQRVTKLCPNSCNGFSACTSPAGAVNVGLNSCNGEDACSTMTAGAVAEYSCNGAGACRQVSGDVGINSCDGDGACDYAISVANCVATCGPNETCGSDGDCITLDANGCAKGYGTAAEFIDFCASNNMDCCVKDPSSPNPACRWERDETIKRKVAKLCPGSCKGNLACNELAAGEISIGYHSCRGGRSCKNTGPVGYNSCVGDSKCENAGLIGNCVQQCPSFGSIPSECPDDLEKCFRSTGTLLTGYGTGSQVTAQCVRSRMNCCVSDDDTACSWIGEKKITSFKRDSCHGHQACKDIGGGGGGSVVVGKESCIGANACSGTTDVGDLSCLGDNACDDAISVTKCVKTCEPFTTCSVELECPSASPSNAPSNRPSSPPSQTPSSLPSRLPSSQPSGVPSNLPSSLPSGAPTTSAPPSAAPTTSAPPSMSPSFSPCPGLMPITRVYTFVFSGDASGITDTQLLDAFVEAYAQLPKQACSANLISLAVANRFSSRRLQDSTPELPTAHVEDHIPHRDLQTTTTVTVEVKSTQVADVSIFQDASEEVAFTQSFTTKVQASSGTSVSVGSLTTFGGCCNGHVWGDFISRKRCPVDNRGCECPGPDCCQVCPETFPGQGNGQGNPNRMLQEEELEGDICPVKQECITTDGLSGLSLYQEQVTKSFLKGGNTVCVSTCFPVEGTVEMVRSGWTCGVCESREGVPE